MGQKNILRHRVPEIRRGTEAKNNDPYFLRKGLKEPAKCSTCQSVYHHKKWYSKDNPIAWKLRNKPMELTVCAACRKTGEHYPAGVVTLRGEFLKNHRDEIFNLIRNEEARAKGVDPLERLISMRDRGNFIEVQTTGEKLAQRIGKDIQRAFKGEVSYHWTGGDKFVRVEWQRGGEAELKKQPA